VVHAGVAGEPLSYLRFDGKAWSKPVAMEGTISTSRPHVAMTKDGAVHLLWRAPSGGEFGHFIVGGDGATRKEVIDFPILRDEFDVGTDPDGNLLVAYQADVPEKHADADAVWVRTLRDGRWTSPTLIGKGSGMMLGGIRMASWKGRTFLTWVHRADYVSGKMRVSGPMRSFVVLNKKGRSEPKPCAKSGDALMQGFMSSHFIGLHVDDWGRVHMAWGRGPRNYYANVAQLGE
jgi:hypothetical protein